MQYSEGVDNESFGQLQDDTFEWITGEASNIHQELLHVAAGRPGGPQPNDKIIGMLDLRRAGGSSLAEVQYHSLTTKPTMVTFDKVEEQLVKVLFTVFHDEWGFPAPYATERVAHVVTLLGDRGGLVVAFGDEPGSAGFKVHSICAVRMDNLANLAASSPDPAPEQ